MTDKCSRCKGSLPTLSERTLEICMNCMRIELCEKLPAYRIELDSAREKIDELKAELDEYRALIDSRKRSDSAQKLGEQAAENLAGYEENPYAPGTVEHVSWGIGHMTVTVQSRFIWRKQVILETKLRLEHVLELAKGYGQKEIVEKLEPTIEKLDKELED